MKLGSKLMSVVALTAGTMQMLSAQQKARIVVPAERVLPMATTLSAVTANPATISFTATDPDAGPYAGSSSATVSWSTSGGAVGSTWTLKVHAAAATFTSCATVPRSAVKVTCTGVSGGSSGTCGGAITLTGTGQQVANGKESASTNAPYSVTLNFTLADSWSYIANSSCSLTLTYTVTAP